MLAQKPPVFDLRPDRALLNPHFENYKLSLDSFTSTEIKFDFAISEIYKPELCHSFHHAKIYSDFNALSVNCIGDGESNTAVVFASNGELMLIDAENMMYSKKIWKIPSEFYKEGAIISACFVRPDLLLVGNGNGHLFVLEVKPTPEASAKELWSGCLNDGQATTAVLMDNAFISENGDVEFLSLATENCNDLPEWVRAKLASTTSRTKVSEESGYVTCVYWHKLSTSSWELNCLGRFVSSSICSLAVRNTSSSGGVILGSERPFVNVMLPEEIETQHETCKNESRLYSWHQDNEFVTVAFSSLHVNTKKEDITVEIKRDSLTVKVVGGNEGDDGFELVGKLGGDVDVEGSTWTLDESPEFVKDPYVDHRCVKKLEITLVKADKGTTWVNCIEGDERGHMILTDDQLTLVRDLTTTSGTKHCHQSIINDDEDDVSAKMCKNGDDNEGHEAVIQWFDETGKQSAVSYVGQPESFLFSRSHPFVDVCLKNDVDGCVWRPKQGQAEAQNGTAKPSLDLEHIATFNALAYVLASKESRRFTSCSPDLKLAAAADCRHHVYVYRSPEPATLINRKSGAHQTVSRQHVIAIDPPEESIIGFQITNSAVFVLTPKRLVKFSLEREG